MLTLEDSERLLVRKSQRITNIVNVLTVSVGNQKSTVRDPAIGDKILDFDYRFMMLYLFLV